VCFILTLGLALSLSNNLNKSHNLWGKSSKNKYMCVWENNGADFSNRSPQKSTKTHNNISRNDLRLKWLTNREVLRNEITSTISSHINKHILFRVLFFLSFLNQDKAKGEQQKKNVIPAAGAAVYFFSLFCAQDEISWWEAKKCLVSQECTKWNRHKVSTWESQGREGERERDISRIKFYDILVSHFQ
jgi:hypothetical protein